MTTTISGTSIVSPSINGTTVLADGLDIRDIPSSIKSSAYTLALIDRSVGIDTNSNVTIPDNATVTFPVGTVITITNTSTTTVSIIPSAGVTLRLAGSTLTGNRSLLAYGMVTIRKVASDTWFIAGAGIA